MPNLFPESINSDEINIENVEESLEFKGSYLFGFEKREFIKSPDGTIVKCDDLEAYKQWCQLSMMTERYKYVFSNLFGQEFRELVKSGLSREAIELEIKRMTEEALKVHPRTKDVRSFNFNWSDNREEVFYTYEIMTIDEENIYLDNIVKVG